MNTHSQRADHGGAAATNPGRWWLAPALLVLTAMLAAACGGGDDGSSGGSTGEGEDASPVSGGELVYGLEAANSGGWCLPEAQLAISGIMVAKQIYDTLTIPNAEAEFVPFLDYSPEIRRVIYSTNAIESLNARFRRATRARGHFPNEQAALKCLYLVVRSLDPKATGQERWMNRWKPALNAFAITFEGRLF